MYYMHYILIYILHTTSFIDYIQNTTLLYVVYRLTCPGYRFCDVGQTSRRLLKQTVSCNFRKCLLF